MENYERIIKEARDKHNITHFYALCSGGKDSLTTTNKAHELGILSGIIYIDTGIRVPETLEHVKTLAKNRGWGEVIVLKPKTTYEEHVLKYGFPRPPSHRWAFITLKWKPLSEFVNNNKDKKIAFLSGVRRKESRRRMRNSTEMYKDNSNKNMIWVSPIIDMSTPEVFQYLKDNNLEISPAYGKIGISGDCLCGAYARAGESELIATYYPLLAKRISELEKVASSVRIDYNKWGNGSSMQGSRKQTKIEEFICFDCIMSD